MQRWKQRPEGANWGDFGPDDQLGRLNLLTAEKVRQGCAEVREGRRFCLSLPLNLPGGNLLHPRRFPPQLRPTELDGEPYINHPLTPHFGTRHTDVVCDDAVLLWTQYSTQWDSFAHIGHLFDADGDGTPEIVFYNGFRAGEHVVGPVDYLAGGAPTGRNYEGASALGIERMAEAAVQGRGVLIDLRAHFGDAHRAVSFAELEAVMAEDRIEVAPGDMVLFHTGFADRIMQMAGAPDREVLHNSCTALNGRDPALLRWVSESGVAALIADNFAVEAVPPEAGGDCMHANLPLHEHCLFKLGVPLGEIWYLTELADWLRENGRSRFLLTAPPLRLPGAVGSPATPVATV